MAVRSATPTGSSITFVCLALDSGQALPVLPVLGPGCPVTRLDQVELYHAGCFKQARTGWRRMGPGRFRMGRADLAQPDPLEKNTIENPRVHSTLYSESWYRTLVARTTAGHNRRWIDAETIDLYDWSCWPLIVSIYWFTYNRYRSIGLKNRFPSTHYSKWKKNQ
jgi:hypothetical protein